MSDIIRTEPTANVSKAVECDNVIYTQALAARDTTQDIRAQVQDILSRIDALLARHGSNKTRILQAHVWLKHIEDFDALNEVWAAWMPSGCAPARCVIQAIMPKPIYLVEMMITAHK